MITLIEIFTEYVRNKKDVTNKSKILLFENLFKIFPNLYNNYVRIIVIVLFYLKEQNVKTNF